MNKITTIILFILWLLVMWGTFSISPPHKNTPFLEGDKEETAISKGATEELDDAKIYATIIERLKTPFDITRYKELLERNIFVKPEKPIGIFTPEDLKLLSVERVTLPFMYKGYIQTPNGGMIGQVNWGEKTYFIKRGDKFKDYRVIDIQRTLLTVEGNEGQLILELKKAVKGKEFVATLYNELDGKTYEVRKGDEINGYKILDITADTVILYGENKEWIIKKER